jgi:hypothetical protein
MRRFGLAATFAGSAVPRSPVLCTCSLARLCERRKGCSGVGARRWAARHGAGGSARWASVSRVHCERERGSRGGRVWRAAVGMRSSSCSGMAAFQGLLVRV